MAKASGGCLCGSIQFTAVVKTGVGACHCSMCRKWSGGPLLSAHVQGQLALTGEENISVYASSEWAERAFCKRCGSNLYYRLLPNPNFPDGEYIISAGSLDDYSALVFDHEVYIDHKPDWYAFSDEQKRLRMTEADILEKFGGV